MKTKELITDRGSRIREAFIALVDQDIPDGRVLKVIKGFLEDFKGEPFLCTVLPYRGYLVDLLESWNCWVRGLTQKSYQKIKDMKAELEKNKRELDLILRAALGLARVEELDPELFQRIFDKEAAAYLFVSVARQICTIISVMGKIPECNWANSDVHHIRDLSGSFDGKKIIRRVRSVFERLGVSYIAPEMIWRKLIMTDKHEEISLKLRNCYWPHYDLFKDMFSTELVFEIKDEDIDLSKTASEEYLCSGLSIGYKKVREEMDRLVEMILKKEHYKDMGISLPKGVLFVGPPGTGKSNMAKYMAYSLQYNKNKYDPDADHKVGFISVVAPELNTPEKVKKLFLEAGEFDDCIIFIDEIDAVAKERDHNFFTPAMYRLMTEMDGFDSNTGILVVAATNAPEALDPAMRRPGRFDREMEISYPDMEDRKALLREFISRLNIIGEEDEPDSSKDEGIQKLARKMAYKTAADIKALVNLSAVSLGSKEAVRNKEKKISYEELETEILEELDRMDIGERKDEETEGESEAEKDFQLQHNEGASATAIHEVGHALISLKEYDKEPFAEITVIPRGEALGYVRHDPDEKKQLTRETMLKRIRIALGGRVAEEIFYGENISAGASQDIRDAYDNAWKMVFLYGMSEKIGPIPLATYENDFLGGNMKYICSDKKRSEGEEEIKAIIERELNEVRDYLKERKEIVERLARKVFEEKTMTGKEFKEEYETLERR